MLHKDTDHVPAGTNCEKIGYRPRGKPCTRTVRGKARLQFGKENSMDIEYLLTLQNFRGNINDALTPAMEWISMAATT